MKRTTKNSGRALALSIARLMDDKKAIDIVILALKKSDVADWVVLCTVESTTQLLALATHVSSTLRDEGTRALHREGQRSTRWLALDYGDVLVHVMTPAVRELYRLETLWEDALRVRWEIPKKINPSKKK